MLDGGQTTHVCEPHNLSENPKSRAHIWESSEKSLNRNIVCAMRGACLAASLTCAVKAPQIRVYMYAVYCEQLSNQQFFFLQLVFYARLQWKYNEGITYESVGDYNALLFPMDLLIYLYFNDAF